jgi:hypothetical protein
MGLDGVLKPIMEMEKMAGRRLAVHFLLIGIREGRGSREKGTFSTVGSQGPKPPL